jgi:hypothetical protein
MKIVAIRHVDDKEIILTVESIESCLEMTRKRTMFLLKRNNNRLKFSNDNQFYSIHCYEMKNNYLFFVKIRSSFYKTMTLNSASKMRHQCDCIQCTLY